MVTPNCTTVMSGLYCVCLCFNSVLVGGVDQNKSSDILNTHRDRMSLNGWMGVWDGAEREVLSSHIEELDWFALSRHVSSKNL